MIHLKNNPTVTVAMPVYNGSMYIRESIESILSQTFSDFEFLIVDDGSIDNSVEIIKTYKDLRITLICNTTNLGTSAALNKAIANASGTYIAIMHCDDISLPNRLEHQVLFMEKNSHIGVCGSSVQIFGQRDQVWCYETDSEDIKCKLLFRSAFVHPVVIMRKSLFSDYNVSYNTLYRYTEDYDLWRQLLSYTHFANIPDILLKYRIHSHQATLKYNYEQQVEAGMIRLEQIHALGISPSAEEFEIHQTLSNGILPSNQELTRLWLQKLENANNHLGYYPKQALTKLLSEFTTKHMW
jgi:glycosyltransferase involved in cell wall biosynthesis